MPLYTVGWALLAVAVCGMAYMLGAVGMTARMLRPVANPDPPLRPVTILKPLHGFEAGLETALTSFLTQDYPAAVQIVFGVRDPSDPALVVVEKLKRDFPKSDIATVVNSSVHGANPKISNVINAAKAAKYDLLTLSDSDITVPPNYLSCVTAAMSRPGVGAVSCLYSGKNTSSTWAQLVAMGTSYHFLPNAAFSIASGLMKPCFGSTIALTREVLVKIGGFEAFAKYFADDYEIGRAVREAGYNIAYPALAVQHSSAEASLAETLAHELRWARTIRILNPAGHFGSLITHPLPMASLGCLMLGCSHISVAILLGLVAVRLGLKLAIDMILGSLTGPLWLMPVRDFLSFGIFLGSLSGNAVDWRGERLRIDNAGAILETS